MFIRKLTEHYNVEVSHRFLGRGIFSPQYNLIYKDLKSYCRGIIEKVLNIKQ